MIPFGCADKPAEKHCWLICCERKTLFRLKNKLKSTDYKPDEQSLFYKRSLLRVLYGTNCMREHRLLLTPFVCLRRHLSCSSLLLTPLAGLRRRVWRTEQGACAPSRTGDKSAIVYQLAHCIIKCVAVNYYLSVLKSPRNYTDWRVIREHFYLFRIIAYCALITKDKRTLPTRKINKPSLDWQTTFASLKAAIIDLSHIELREPRQHCANA
jgi:hypothetical protein